MTTTSEEHHAGGSESTHASSQSRPQGWATKGLPPKHCAHVRALLTQWLSHQTTQNFGLPGNTSRSRIWDDDKVKEIVDAISKGLLVAQKDVGKHGLLEIDWADWAAKAWRRRDTWKQEQADAVKRKHKETMDKSTLRFLKRASQSDVDVPKRGRQLSVGTPNTIAPMIYSAISTPTRQNSRPASIASSAKSAVKADDFSDQLTAGLKKTLSNTSSGSSASDAAQDKWCDKIRSLIGYEPLVSAKRDEWEVVDDNQPRSSFQILPGAFPQGESSHMRQPTEITMSSNQPSDATKDCSMLKPVFCLQFSPIPPPSATASNASTIRVRDRSSGSVGSNAAWWASGKRQSEMTIKGRDTREFEIHFVQGRFALPSNRMRASSIRQSSSVTTPASAALKKTLSNETTSSAWSDSDQSHGSFGDCNHNVVIGGGEDDIPCEGLEGGVGVVGGTFVIRGVSDPIERDAITKTLQHLLYTIQSMKIELEVFDAFGIPRETESASSTDLHPGPTRDEIVRRSSVKETRDKRGFFGRFVGRDPREVLDNIFRPHRSRLGQNYPTDDPLHGTRQRSPSFDSLGIDSPPLGKIADRDTQVYSASTNHPTASKDKTIFPTNVDTDFDLLANIKRLKVSTTPGLVIPPPTLLTRADDEARKRKNDAEHAEGGLKLLFGSEGPANSASVVTADQPSGQRSGGDIRVGLKAFRTDIDTFEGWARSQRLDTLRSVSAGDHRSSESSDSSSPEICQKPLPETFVFYDHERDTTLLDVIRGLQAEMEDMAACLRSGCVATAQDHLRSWYHGDKRVTLRAEKVDSKTMLQSGVQEVVDGPVDMVLEAYMTCLVCRATSESRTMTEGAACYSWGKLMELLIYSDTLDIADLCKHPQSARAHAFKAGGVVALVSVEPFTVHDMRLPQLQVGPNVNKREAGRYAAEEALERLASQDQADIAREKLAKEFRDYYESVAKVLLHLDELTILSDEAVFHPEAKVKPEWKRDERRTKLQLMGFEIQRLQLELDEVVSHIPSGQLNEARILLGKHHKLMDEMFTTYLKDNKISGNFGDVAFDLPEWLNGPQYALPGGSLLVREDDPSSIIAHTLSSLAYYIELGESKRTKTDDTSVPSIAQPEHCGEAWKVDVRRRDNVHDIFTLRNITKKQADVTAAPSKPAAMIFQPPQPSQELSLEQVLGQTEPHENLSDLVKTISKAAGQDPVLAARTDSPRITSHTASPSLSSWHEDAPFEDGWGSPKRHTKRRSGLDHLMPEAMHPISRSVSSDGTSVPITPNSSAGLGSPSKEDGWGSVTSNFTSALLKMGSGVGETLGSFRMRAGDRSLSSMLGPLSHMSQADNALGNPAHGRLPHIVFTYTLGERLKLSCTVYFADAFDSLRRRCAIEKAMIDSLSQVENWDASGGKSKAAFFMTKDKRFIVKELVAGWIGSDTNAMLELGPEYFRFTQSTYNKATSLVKIVGFFSVATHDRKSGSKKNMDLLVMENLFYKHEITKTYDLKGIEGRKVSKPAAPPAGTAEAKAAGSATLWDGDWLDSIARRPILLYPHAKRILTEAIATDTRFLAAQSVMDYSLLLGIDKSTKELVVGIVDSIGSYDLWKTIESKGKLLTRGGEVTVIPPGQYKERFENALNKYFLACPDKWSKTIADDTGSRILTSFL